MSTSPVLLRKYVIKCPFKKMNRFQGSLGFLVPQVILGSCCRERWVRKGQRSEQWHTVGAMCFLGWLWDVPKGTTQFLFQTRTLLRGSYTRTPVYARGVFTRAWPLCLFVKRPQGDNDVHMSLVTAAGTKHKFKFYPFSQLEFSYS